MSHFLTFVFVSPDEANIEQRVNYLFEPYFDLEMGDDQSDVKCDGFVIGGRYDREIFGVAPMYNLTPPEFQKHYGLDVIRVEDNVRPAPEIPEGLVPYAVLTPEGEWFECNDHPDWKDKVEELLRHYSDQLVVAVDCHC